MCNNFLTDLLRKIFAVLCVVSKGLKMFIYEFLGLSISLLVKIAWLGLKIMFWGWCIHKADPKDFVIDS